MHSTEIEKVLRKHWNETAVLIDTLHSGTDEQELKEADLLPGELAAVTFKVGCYIVRSAQRIYRIDEPIPASKEETELVRKGVERKNVGSLEGYSMTVGMSVMDSSWADNLHIVHEISARHHANPSQEFTFICRAAQARNYSWIETINEICTAKEYGLVPNEYASLFVLHTFLGSSSSEDTWYQLAPTGKIMSFRLNINPFASDRYNMRFT